MFFTLYTHVPANAGGVGSVTAMSPAVGAALSGLYSFDSKNKNQSLGTDINLHMFVITGGVSYRNWNEMVNKYKDEYTGYIGIGLLHLIQAQYGYSSDIGSLIRIRSDIYLLSEKPPFIGLDDPFDGVREGGFPLILYIEKPLNTSKRGWTFGLGVGLAF